MSLSLWICSQRLRLLLHGCGLAPVRASRSCAATVRRRARPRGGMRSATVCPLAPCAVLAPPPPLPSMLGNRLGGFPAIRLPTTHDRHPRPRCRHHLRQHQRRHARLHRSRRCQSVWRGREASYQQSWVGPRRWWRHPTRLSSDVSATFTGVSATMRKLRDPERAGRSEHAPNSPEVASNQQHHRVARQRQLHAPSPCAVSGNAIPVLPHLSRPLTMPCTAAGRRHMYRHRALPCAGACPLAAQVRQLESRRQLRRSLAARDTRAAQQSPLRVLAAA